ncbi:unnamed protein product, partial [Brassica oleracea var. botrytis]
MNLGNSRAVLSDLQRGAINESSHKITKSDHFAKVASDGLFDFFSNKEAIELLHGFISIY